MLFSRSLLFTALTVALFTKSLASFRPPGPPRPDDAEALLRSGLLEAERFRRDLIATPTDGPSRAVRLAESIVRFRDRASRVLEAEGRPTLARFRLTAPQIADRIAGQTPIEVGARGFARFTGRWYGSWDGRDVDHHWTMVQRAALQFDDHDPFDVDRLQYAWIGDGFGWNALTIPHDLEPEHEHDVGAILGAVYHVRNGDPNAIQIYRPHVGIADLDGRLIWITQREVFLEEVLPESPPRYAITGFHYQDRDGVIAIRGSAFQAIYTRTPGDRPRFHRFHADLHD